MENNLVIALCATYRPVTTGELYESFGLDYAEERDIPLFISEVQDKLWCIRFEKDGAVHYHVHTFDAEFNMTSDHYEISHARYEA